MFPHDNLKSVFEASLGLVTKNVNAFSLSLNHRSVIEPIF